MAFNKDDATTTTPSNSATVAQTTVQPKDTIPPDKPPGLAKPKGVLVIVQGPTKTETIDIPCHEFQDEEELYKLVLIAVDGVRAEWRKH